MNNPNENENEFDGSITNVLISNNKQ